MNSARYLFCTIFTRVNDLKNFSSYYAATVWPAPFKLITEYMAMRPSPSQVTQVNIGV